MSNIRIIANNNNYEYVRPDRRVMIIRRGNNRPRFIRINMIIVNDNNRRGNNVTDARLASKIADMERVVINPISIYHYKGPIIPISIYHRMYRAPIMRIMEYRRGNNSSVRRACKAIRIRNAHERSNGWIKRKASIRRACRAIRNGHERDVMRLRSNSSNNLMHRFQSVLDILLADLTIDFPN